MSDQEPVLTLGQSALAEWIRTTYPEAIETPGDEEIGVGPEWRHNLTPDGTVALSFQMCRGWKFWVTTTTVLLCVGEESVALKNIDFDTRASRADFDGYLFRLIKEQHAAYEGEIHAASERLVGLHANRAVCRVVGAILESK